MSEVENCLACIMHLKNAHGSRERYGGIKYEEIQEL